MHAALWLPRFHLQAVLRQMPASPSATLAVLDEMATGSKDKARVLHATAAAEKSGVRAGMTASQAQARCPRLGFVPREAAHEATAQQALLEIAVQWTPDFESTLPGFCVLNLERLRDMQGREQICGERLHTQLGQQQLDVRVGFALNADLAMLAAQTAQPVLVLRTEAETAAFLQGLPVTALRPSSEIQEVLALWGVGTLGQLIQLPRADIAARLGREGVMLWDMAAGGRDRLLKFVRPAVGYHEEHDLDHPIECLEPLLFLLRRMLQGLCARLSGAWMVAAMMVLTLRFDDKSEHCRELHVAEPTRDEELLFRVLHTHLESLSAAAPIVFLGLEIKPTRPAGNQALLFERSLRDPHRFAETLARLEALLGVGKVGKARLLPSRRTDAFAVVNFLGAPEPVALPGEALPLALPLRRLRPSPLVNVTMMLGRPAAFAQGRQQHEVSEAEGPWFLSGDWWDIGKTWSKEVWVVQTQEGLLYQLARQNEQWVVEGTLG